jgi:broad specificity phosphatase PhoE
MKQVLLVRHGPTIATESAGFPADEALIPDAVAAAATLATALPDGHRVVCSPALRARQTAAAAGLIAQKEPRLAECDFGSWAGRRLVDIHAVDPEATSEWMTDPDARPHGGESLNVFSARIAAWLDEEAGRPEPVMAVTHGGVIKASVVHALGADSAAFWRIEVRPLSITELCARDDAWSVVRTNWTAAG